MVYICSLIEQHSNFLFHTLQVLYMCKFCDSMNINTIIEFVPNCLQHVIGDGFSGGSVSYLQFRDTHAPCLLKLCIPPSNGTVRWWLFPEFGAELLMDNCTPTIILNNPVYKIFYRLRTILGRIYWLVTFTRNNVFPFIHVFVGPFLRFPFCSLCYRQLRDSALRHLSVRLASLPSLVNSNFMYSNLNQYTYSDTSANEDNAFRYHIRQPKRYFPQVSIENRLIRSGCCPLFKDKFYKIVKSTL